MLSLLNLLCAVICTVVFVATTWDRGDQPPTVADLALAFWALFNLLLWHHDSLEARAKAIERLAAFRPSPADHPTEY